MYQPARATATGGVVYVPGPFVVNVPCQAGAPSRRKAAAIAVADFIQRERIQRPLFGMDQRVWVDGCGVVLYAYKRHPRLAVDDDWVRIFGEPLAATGREDVQISIVGPGAHGEMLDRPGDQVIFAQGDLFIHARRLR